MKVTAISALHQAMGKAHLNVAMDQVYQKRNGTVQATANPTSTKIELGPTAAARLIKSDHLDGYAILTPSSSTSIAAQFSNINLLSEPDAVAQEMASNLRPSMSQSGEALLDITMPDNPIGASAHSLEEKREANIPMALRNLQEQLMEFYSGPNKMVQLETEYTESDKPYPVPLTKQNEPLSDVAISMKGSDFLFTPNRSQERPLEIPPDDIPYTEVPKRVAELLPKANELGNIAQGLKQEDLAQLERLQSPEYTEAIKAPPKRAMSIESQKETLKPASFDIKDPETVVQTEILKTSAEQSATFEQLQSVDALLKQFNASFN